MTFSRNHFQSVADVIADTMENMDQPHSKDAIYFAGKVAGIEEVADNMAAMFIRDNEAFDRARFIEACGLSKS